MNTNTDWTTFPDGLEAIAQQTGPFGSRPFLETAWKHRTPNHKPHGDAMLHIETSDTGGVAIAITDERIELVGQSNLTDYHTPVGEDGAACLAAALSQFDHVPFVLDSLPLEAALAVGNALSSAGIVHDVAEEETTSVVILPPTHEDWLASLAKKQRHEVRRKIRRFESEFGAIEVERHAVDALEVFTAMHRTSRGAKGEFMTTAMADFFLDLVLDAEASIHILSCEGEPMAAAFGFETADGYYFYNSAFKPEAQSASPGIVLLSAMIETQIARGVVVFDFLKGDERYKTQHGAVPRQLYRITGGRK